MQYSKICVKGAIKPSSEVFISYSHEDSGVADEISEILSDRQIQFFGRQSEPQDGYERSYEVDERDVAAAPDGW